MSNPTSNPTYLAACLLQSEREATAARLSSYVATAAPILARLDALDAEIAARQARIDSLLATLAPRP